MDFTEPMTMGSPINSPSHISPTHQTPHGSQFLPGYLMGDLNISSASNLNRSKSMLGGGPSQHNSPTVNYMISQSPPQQKSSMRTPKQIHFATAPVATKEKVGAPPVQTLMDDFGQAEGMQTSGYTDMLFQSSAYQDVSTASPSFHGRPGSPNRTSTYKVLTPRQGKTPPSPGQADPFYTQGELITPHSQLDNTWVTVFGFPVTSASFIMQRFSQYGCVLNHHTASDGGNWMHIHYETSLQAKKALSRNGKIFPGNIMIGVVPCIDMKVMAGKNATTNQNTSFSTCQSPAIQSDLNRTGTPIRAYKPTSIRPLTAAYNAASSDNKVVSDVRTPQKTSGMLTKAMDYIFG